MAFFQTLCPVQFLDEFFGWMSQGGHSEPLLPLALFYQSTPSCSKVRGGWCGWGGGPCDFSVSPSPFGLDFGTLDFGTSDSGLTILSRDMKILYNSVNYEDGWGKKEK